jgi:pilus assembly protein CpaB
MDRRFLTVLGVSLVFALVVSSIFYQMSARAGNSPGKVERTDLTEIIKAAKPLATGVSIKPDDVKVDKVPIEHFPKGAFSKVEEVIDRPVVSNILVDEPILEGRLASRGSGMGLAPVIPVGMRAVSVRVNEVVGVAGFVLPGMRVDVLVTGRPPEGSGSMTTTVLQNILVLSAGQTIQPDTRGQAINAPVVTLLVTPDQAEVLTLAGNEGRIQLVLRNSSDQQIAQTPGRDIGELYRRALGPRKSAEASPGDSPRRRPVVVARAEPETMPPPVVSTPPPPPPPDQVIVIRGTQRSVETVGSRGGANQ